MREHISLNQEWIFVDNNKTNLKAVKKMPKTYSTVNLPHTLNNYTIASGAIPQATMWYKKSFLIDPRHTDKFINLCFDGVMSECEIFFNGKSICKHVGGYVPINLDITKLASFGKPNVLAIKVSNRDNATVLPGVSLKHSEYQYFGGLYRGVSITAKEEVHITETNYDEGVSGGVRIYDETVNSNLAVLSARIEVYNASNRTNKINITANIYDRNGKLLHIFTSPDVQVKASRSESIEVTSRVDNPIFWSPDCPYLYEVEYLVSANGGIVDSVRLKHGFRTIKRDHRGFILNGKRMYLRGANRVQQYPYLGMSVGNRAEYRDAYKIKKAGFNIVRLIGGGNSQAFLQACDELGIMVINCIPSQQFCTSGEFQDNVVSIVRQMARRDRNHTCIVMWEPCLSETGDWVNGATDKFFLECKTTLLHELAYGASPLIAGDTIGRHNPQEIDFDVPYTEHDDRTMQRHLNSLPGRKGLVKGYGDYEFGEEWSTTRADRQDGEKAMLLQAWNYQWSHNRNINNRYVIGDLIWNNVDYIRPNAPNNIVCKSGIMDIFRLPKFSYYFYRSQMDMPGEYMVYPATFWDDENINSVPIYTNCDKVELYLNGVLLGAKSPIKNPQDEFIGDNTNRKRKAENVAESNNNFWAIRALTNKLSSIKKPALAKFALNKIYNGNSSNKLAHPPIIFDNLTYAKGTLKAVGIVGGKAVCEHIVSTPEAPDNLEIKIDYCSKALLCDNQDFVFCYVKVNDKNGTTIATADNHITCNVTNGTIIGHTSIRAVAGVATFMIKANTDAEEVVVEATSEVLKPATQAVVLQHINDTDLLQQD